jgi:GH35 family endo-1,4-beta-xylanase
MRKISFLLTALLCAAFAVAAWPRSVAFHPLKEAPKQRPFRIGVTDSGFGSALYANTIAYAFNSLTPESVMKFESIHPCPPQWLIESNASVAAWVGNEGAARCTLENAADDEWHWEKLHRLLTWAQENNIGVRGHTLLWHMQNPGWLTHETISLTRAERQRVMEEHIMVAIRQTCSYANLYAYDVVNEGIQPDGTLLPTPWSTIPNYIDLAFRTAHQSILACNRPDIKLYYNDFSFEYGEDKADALYNYLGSLLLRQNPTPIDGIGFQTHSQYLHRRAVPHDTAALRATLERFANGLHLETAITETDLPISATPRWPWYEEQARWFGERLQACLNAPHCVGYTLWGTHDGASWRVYFKGDLDPLIFHDATEMVFDPDQQRCVAPGALRLPGNERYCPKPAYQSLWDAFR